jgi:type IV pilus assembly protein PilM
LTVSIFGRTRAVGLDIGKLGVRVVVLEGSPEKPRITGAAAAQIKIANGAAETTQAIHAALAHVDVTGVPVVAAIGGADIVVRQVTMPPVPPVRLLQVLELQHREFGLLAPEDGVLDAQILRRTKSDYAVLAVSAPKPLVEARLRLLEQASVKVETLEVEALAVMNALLHMSRPDGGELIVALVVGEEQSLLCLRSERGPVVVRYLDTGASALIARLQAAGLAVPSGASTKAPAGPDGERQAEVCRDVVRQMAEEIRKSLAFYRSEYDRDGLPRYVLSGWLRLPQFNRWLTEALRLQAPFEVADPFNAVPLTASPADVGDFAGPEFVQAFGLALRAQ